MIRNNHSGGSVANEKADQSLLNAGGLRVLEQDEAHVPCPHAFRHQDAYREGGVLPPGPLVLRALEPTQYVDGYAREEGVHDPHECLEHRGPESVSEGHTTCLPVTADTGLYKCLDPYSLP